MSRKSLSKKEPTIWYLCNNCNINIFAKDCELHICDESTTQLNYTFVADKKLFSNQLKVEKRNADDLRLINENKTNNLIFVHESIFSLCELVLGDYVLISSSALPHDAPIVRMAWPSTNPNGSLAGVTEYGLLKILLR